MHLKKHRKSITLVAFLAGALGIGSACVSTPEDLGLVEGRLGACPSSPNCVCSEDGDASIDPLAYTGDGKVAFRALLALLESQPRVDLVTVEEEYAHAVFRTPLLRFRDDLELRLDSANSVIQVRSASRVGHSDMGANRRRIENLRALWKLSETK